MRLSRRNARAMRHGIAMARLAMMNDKPISGIVWETYNQVNCHIHRAYLRTMEPYNQLEDLRRVVNGN